MRAVSALAVCAVVTVAAAQSTDPPLSETRLTVHTLLREDLFAGFIGNDMTRFARGERNIQVLLAERPDAKASLLAWKGGAELYRAVLAQESSQADEFKRHDQEARASFAEAATLEPGSDAVWAIIGGTYALFADRLPAAERGAAWAQAYAAYSRLWKQQGAAIDKLPLHHRGEVLAGMAQSAQRTGRAEEAAAYVDKMLILLSGTQYEPVARQWKDNPSAAAGTNLTCKSCHAPGRLSARLAALDK